MNALRTSRASGVRVIAAAERFGVKGRDAAALLAHCGVPVPAGPNACTHWQAKAALGTGRCLRMGQREFLLERDEGASLRERLRAAQPALAAGAFLLPRADHCLLLDGPQWPQELARVCSFDFERLRHEPDTVVMTLLADIAVTFIREPAQTGSDRLALRLWCDPGYADYLEHSLTLIAGGHPQTTGDRR